MIFSKIERQVLNLIMTINNLMEDTNISCVMEFLSDDRNMKINLSLKKDGKISNARFDIDVLSEDDYAFYNYFLSMIIDNYMNHNKIFISDISKESRMITAINNEDVEYMFKIGHVDGLRNIKIFFRTRNNIDDIINIYNGKLLNVDNTMVINKKNK